MLALLHTSPVHVETFDRLRDEEAPGLTQWHLVDAELLARAQREGPAGVAADVEAHLRQAKRDGAAAVLCTCSTLGGIAEELAATSGVAVVRVDRPMAEAAVAIGRRIRVLAALASTAGPTRALIEQVGGDPDVSIVDGAWARFEAGDRAGYLSLVAAAIDATTGVDVIVLAQASMADAATLATVDIPVLSSPRLGFRAAAHLAAANLAARPG